MKTIKGYSKYEYDTAGVRNIYAGHWLQPTKSPVKSFSMMGDDGKRKVIQFQSIVDGNPKSNPRMNKSRESKPKADLASSYNTVNNLMVAVK